MRTRYDSVKRMLLVTSLATAIGCGPDLGFPSGPGKERGPTTRPISTTDTLPLTYFAVGLICPYCGRDTVYELPDDAPAHSRERTLASVRIGIGDDDAIAPAINGFRLANGDSVERIWGHELDWAITSSDPDVAIFSRGRGNGNVFNSHGWVIGVSPGEARITVKANNLTHTFVVIVEE